MTTPIRIVRALCPVLLLGALLVESRAAGPWRADASNAQGGEGMTAAQRIRHQRRMRGFRSLEACAAYEATRRRAAVGEPRTPPLPITTMAQGLQRHKYRAQDPGLVWLRGLLRRAVARMDGAPDPELQP